DFHEEIVAFSRLAGQERKAPWPLAPRDRAPYSNRAIRSRPEFAADRPCAHRLAVQDVALSRRKHGFESRWARQRFQGFRSLHGFARPSVRKLYGKGVPERGRTGAAECLADCVAGLLPEPAPERCAASDRRALHHHEAGALKVLNQAPSDNLGHDLVRVVRPLAPMEAQRERERVGDVVGRGGCEAVSAICHGPMVAAMRERNKNDCRSREPANRQCWRRARRGDGDSLWLQDDRTPPPPFVSSQKRPAGSKMSLRGAFHVCARDFFMSGAFVDRFGGPTVRSYNWLIRFFRRCSMTATEACGARLEVTLELRGRREWLFPTNFAQNPIILYRPDNHRI